MGRSVVLGALLLVAANVSFTQAQAVEYFKVGGRLQLRPQPVSEQIYSVVWKYGKNLLAEWVKDQIPLTYYSKFKNRTTLHTDTGVLEIRNMTAADNGTYSVEINNQVQSRVYQAVEIKDVSKPVVELKPLSCSSASPDCKLVCEGDVSKAGPVEYFWMKDGGEWEKSKENTMDITNDAATQGVKTFSCRIKNQFSEEDSNAFKNPFQGVPTEPPPLAPWVIGLIVSFVIILVVVALSVVLYRTFEPFKNKVDAYLPCNKGADAAETTAEYTAVSATNGGADQPKKEENTDPKSDP